MERQIFKKTYKYRLYLTRTQENILERHLSLCRWLYNHFLEERRTLYEKSKTKISCFDQIKEIPNLKKEKPELKEVYSQTLQDVPRRLDKAFQNFFRRVKENKQGKKQKLGFPRFKGYWRYDSFVYPQSGFELKEGKLYPVKFCRRQFNRVNLSKIGSLKIKLHDRLRETLKP